MTPAPREGLLLALALSACAPPPAARPASAPIPSQAVAIEAAPVEAGPVAPEALGTIGAPVTAAGESQRRPTSDGRELVLRDGTLVFGDGREVDVDGEGVLLIAALTPERALLSRAGAAAEIWAPDGRVAHVGHLPSAKHALAVTEGALAMATKRGFTVYDADGKTLGTIAGPSYVGSIAVGDRGRVLLVTRSEEVTLYEVATGKALATVPKSKRRFAKVGAVSLDGRRFTTRADGGPVVVRSRSGDPLVELRLGRHERIERLDFVGQHLVARVRRISDPARVVVLSAKAPRDIPGGDYLHAPADGDHLWTYGAEGLVRCRVATAECPAVSRHGGPVRHLAVAGRLAVSSAADGSVFVHRLRAHDADSTLLLRAFRAEAPHVAASAQGVAVAGWLDPKAKHRYRSEPSPSLAFYAAAQGGVVASAPTWRSPTDGYFDDVVSVGASSAWVTALDEEGDVHLYEPSTGKLALTAPVARFVKERWRDETAPSLLSPNGVILAQADGVVTFPEGRVVAPPWSVDEKERFSVERCVFSPGGRALLCPDEGAWFGRTAEGWKAEAFPDPDGGFAWAVSDEGAVAVSALRDDDAVLRLRSAPGEVEGDDDPWSVLAVPSPVTALTFYAQGRRLMTGHRDGRLMVWRVP